MINRFGQVSLSVLNIRGCMNVIKTCLLLLLLQTGVRGLAQADWTAAKAKMNANTRELGEEFVFVLATADSTLWQLENKGFTAKLQVPIASSSKWLTAALIFKLAEEGKLSLEDPVVRYIPDFGKYFKSYITIRQCLSHMTGIEQKGIVRSLVQRSKYNSLEEEVLDFATLNIRAKPGTDCWYGNIGLNIAGRVAEIVSKKKFDVLIKSKLLTPLGMRRTSFTNLGGGPINPSGGAVSTAEDYLKFLQMLLRKGKVNQQSFLSEASVQALLTLQATPEQVTYAPLAAKNFGYASGAWVVERKAGNATTLASPGLFGTWPMIDLCRGYAYLLVTKNMLSQDKAELHLEMKDLIDRQLPNRCSQ